MSGKVIRESRKWVAGSSSRPFKVILRTDGAIRSSHVEEPAMMLWNVTVVRDV